MFLLVAAALAAPNCSPLEEGRFRAALDDAQSALERGDLELTEQGLALLHSSIPCLTFAPRPWIWADLMVVEAVVAFSNGKDWEAPLAAALRIRPGIDRLVGRAHPMFSWVPPEQEPLIPFQPTQQLFVDGEPVQARPPSTGWYLVQKTNGKKWETVWQRGAPLSSTWLAEPVATDPTLSVEAELGLMGGSLTQGQILRIGNEIVPRPVVYSSESFQSEWAGNASIWDALLEPPRFALGVEFGLSATFYSPFGLAAWGSIVLGPSPSLRRGKVSLIWTPKRWIFGVGLTGADLVMEKRDETGKRVGAIADFRRFYHVEVTRDFGPSLRMHGLVGATSLRTLTVQTDITYFFSRVASLPLDGQPYFGAELNMATGYFAGARNSYELDSMWLNVGLRVGVRFGGVQ